MLVVMRCSVLQKDTNKACKQKKEYRNNDNLNIFQFNSSAPSHTRTHRKGIQRHGLNLFEAVKSGFGRFLRLQSDE